MKRPPYIFTFICLAALAVVRWIWTGVRGTLEGPIATDAIKNTSTSSSFANLVASGLFDKLILVVFIVIIAIVWIRYLSQRRVVDGQGEAASQDQTH